MKCQINVFLIERYRVKAYYAQNMMKICINSLKPEKKICDKSVILHELIHHYQKNDNRIHEFERTYTMDLRRIDNLLSKFIFDIIKINSNKNTENVLECEGGTYLDLQYKYNKE